MVDSIKRRDGVKIRGAHIQQVSVFTGRRRTRDVR